MATETNLHLGKGIVRGDQFSIRRHVTHVPTGVTISSATLTIKNEATDPDIDAIIQKVVTTSDSPGVGRVEDAGADGMGTIRFDLTSADTLLLNPDQKKPFDIQITLASGDILTLEYGKTWAIQQVTIS